MGYTQEFVQVHWNNSIYDFSLLFHSPNNKCLISELITSLRQKNVIFSVVLTMKCGER